MQPFQTRCQFFGAPLLGAGHAAVDGTVVAVQGDHVPSASVTDPEVYLAANGLQSLLPLYSE